MAVLPVPSALVILAGLAVLAGLAACGTPEEPGGGIRRVVIVSGRDDHGLVASPDIVLHSDPEGGSAAGSLPDGTLAQVIEVRGTQVQVSALGELGWVDDFALRGEARLLGPPPGCRVRISGHDLPAGTRVEVLSVRESTAEVRLLDPPHTVGTVAASDLGELGPPPGKACPPAGSGRTDDH